MIDEQLLATIKKTAEHFVTVHRGMTGQHLISNLIADTPSANRELIERSIAELVQDRKLIRIEYQIPDLGTAFYAFYLPEGSRLL